MQIINTGLLSFGMSGRVFHAPFINLHKRFHLAGAWERSRQVLQETYPLAKSYPTLQAILDDELIDLIVVNTPTYTHYEYAAKALQAGKHVVIEKAITTTTAEAQALKALAIRQGKQIAVYQNRRWDSDFLTVKHVIDSNVLGDLNEVEIHFDRYNLLPSPKQHKETPNPGAGILKDLGPHAIDQALHLIGMPQALFADLRITRRLSAVDDSFDLLLYYPTLRVRLKASYMVKEPIPAYVVHGTKGSFLKPRGDIQEAMLLKGMVPDDANWGREPATTRGMINYDKEGETVREEVSTLNGNYAHFYDGVFDALTHGTPMPVTVDDGINVMRIIEAAIKSSETRQVIAL
jgi:predicted dehydrogenase